MILSWRAHLADNETAGEDPNALEQSSLPPSADNLKHPLKSVQNRVEK